MNNNHDDEFAELAELAELDDDIMPSWTPRAEPSEGVRILGAAVTGETPEVSDYSDPPTWSASSQGLIPEADEVEEATAVHHNIDEPVTGEYIVDDEDATWGEYVAASAASNEFDSGTDQPVSEVIADAGLPHWSEPATGAIPRVLIDGGADVRSTGSTPRFRNAPGDWEGDEGFAALESEGEDGEVVAPAAATRRASRARSTSETDSGSTGGGRDLPTAIATGLVLGVAGLICLLVGGLPAALAVGVVAFLCAWEFFEGLRMAGMRSVPATLLCLVGSAAMPLAVAWKGLAAFLVVFVVVMWAMFLWYLLGIGGGRPVLSMGSSVLGFAYIGGMAAFGGQFVFGGDPYSSKALLGVVLCVIAADAIGFFVGSNMGNTPLSPRISPNKTLEGLVGGLLGSVLMGIIVSFMIDAWDGIGHGILLGLVVGIIGPFGDLAESMLKRDLGIKDFGSVLPGHGGVLDRFDAMLFCLPAGWFLWSALA